MLFYLLIFKSETEQKFYSISGKVTDAGVGVSGISITLSGEYSQKVTTDSKGEYTITNIPRGMSVSLTPTSDSYQFNPPLHNVNKISNVYSGLNFTIVGKMYSISGRVTTEDSGLDGVRIRASDGISQAVTTNSRGEYTVAGVPFGKDIKLIARREGYNFSPSSHVINNVSKNTLGINFIAIKDTYSISGKVIEEGVGLSGVTIQVSGGHSETVITNSRGEYTISNVSYGSDVNIKPRSILYDFTPDSYKISMINDYSTGNNFIAINRTGIVSDIDGNIYKTIKIGNQWWMAENLNVSRFRNGESIAKVITDNEWEHVGYREKKPAWSYYDNNSENGEKYGKLYNWYVVDDYRGICPDGWHVPYHDDWIELENYLNGRNVAGGKMKSTTGWRTPNIEATNESGWSGLPGGVRGSRGFNRIGERGIWWSSSVYMTGYPRYRILDYKSGRINSEYSRIPMMGFSIRCIKEN